MNYCSGAFREFLSARISNTVWLIQDRSTSPRCTCVELGRTRHLLLRRYNSALNLPTNPSRSSAPSDSNQSLSTNQIARHVTSRRSLSDMDLEHSGLQEVANAMRGDGLHESAITAQKRKRESESADDTRRGNKRVSPNASGNKDHQDGGVEALQDYNSLHHQVHLDHNGSAEHASTAAAALAGIYPTMTVPQPTDVSFATQGSDGDRNQESSFMDNSHHQDSFMDSSTPSGGRSKPAVGSDEWHKVRKDNHKEGEFSGAIAVDSVC